MPMYCLKIELLAQITHRSAVLLTTRGYYDRPNRDLYDYFDVCSTENDMPPPPPSHTQMTDSRHKFSKLFTLDVNSYSVRSCLYCIASMYDFACPA